MAEPIENPAERVAPPEPAAVPVEEEEIGLLERLHIAFGPILGGILIDVADLITFGPLGIYTGMIIGGSAGYWVASLYGFDRRMRLLWALAAGVYCTLPITEVFPVATMIGAIARFRSPRG